MSDVLDLLTSVERACGISTNGKDKTDYKEIIKLADMLKQAEIPYEIRELNGGYQICYPSFKFRICSAVEHSFSYGGECDTIEIMGLLTKAEQDSGVGGKCSVKGFLSAENVFSRIKKFHTKWAL